jgi:hypothetical protein
MSSKKNNVSIENFTPGNFFKHSTNFDWPDKIRKIIFIGFRDVNNDF